MYITNLSTYSVKLFFLKKKKSYIKRMPFVIGQNMCNGKNILKTHQSSINKNYEIKLQIMEA